MKFWSESKCHFSCTRFCYWGLVCSARTRVSNK